MKTVYQVHEIFWANSFYLILYILCLIILYTFNSHMKVGKKILGKYTVIIGVFLVYNPIFVIFSFRSFFTIPQEYVRTFYLLPIWVTIAYVIIEILFCIKFKWKRNTMLILITLLLIFSGTSYYAQGMYTKPENIYKISNTAIEISEMILKDSQGEAHIVIRHPVEEWDRLYWGIRQYTSKIKIMSECICSDEYDDSYGEVFDEYWNKIECSTTFEYVVIENNINMVNDIIKFNYIVVGRSGEFVVLKKVI